MRFLKIHKSQTISRLTESEKMKVSVDNREFLRKEMKQAISDYKVAHNEEERWECRSRMAQTERVAGELYGFEFADKLAEMKRELKK